MSRLLNPRTLLLLFVSTPLLFGDAFGYPADVPVDKSGERTILSTPTDSHITIDGILNETIWGQVKFQGNFIQREPAVGEPVSEKTQIAILQSKDNLYIGIKCFDSEPDKIIARDMRRDSEIQNDDFFQIVIDTYHDHRNGYYFKTNPNGAKRDATIGDEGKNYNPDWDGIWDCAAKINDEGWFAEIEIPWKTLNFLEADTVTWGVNFARGIMRKNETSYWQLVSRDAGRMGLFRFSQAGTLTGLTNLKSGGRLEILPYVLGGLERDSQTNFKTENIGDFGIDAKIGLTSNLHVNLTWNTDFAQVESDQEQVNLTRFSLYFPEKREFFLEGAEVFNFGGAESRRSRGGSSSGIRLFYSRRIGIAGHVQQPILGGARMIGKVGNYQVGLLNMQTEETAYYDEDEDEGVFFASTNYTALRVRRDVLKRSNVGFMFLNKQEQGTDLYNRSGGVDANFPITDRIVISGALAGTNGPDEIDEDDEDQIIDMSTNNFAGNLSFAYDSDLWEYGISHMDIQENFNAKMGYVRRTNIKSTSSNLEFNPRPKRWKSIRQISYRLRHKYLTDHQNNMLEAELNSSFSINFQNSARIFGGIERNYEYLDEDWEVRPDIWIPKDTYKSWRGYMWFFSNESADIACNLYASYGDYYTGKSLRAGPEVTIYNFDRIRMDADVSYNFVDLPDEGFTTKTIGFRLYYYFSTKLYLKTYLQWNDDRKANDGNQISIANVLLHWIYKPGSDFYLVFNEGRLISPSAQEITNRTVMLKANFFWRK